jgi:hypothetical protein
MPTQNSFRFFGDWHTAIGKTIRYENKRDFKVTGILENTPANTDFPMKLVMSWATLVQKRTRSYR